METKIITSFTAHQTAEGMRVSYTFSVIDSNGNLLKSNQRETCIVMDSNILSAIGDINAWLNDKLTSTN